MLASRDKVRGRCKPRDCDSVYFRRSNFGMVVGHNGAVEPPAKREGFERLVPPVAKFAAGCFKAFRLNGPIPPVAYT